MLTDIDFAVLDFLQRLANPALDGVMVFLTSLGDGGAVWIILCAAMLIGKRHRFDGLCMAGALILGFVICNIALKPMIARVRPFAVNGTQILINAPRDFSFPSGHTLTAFAAAFSLVLCQNRIAPAAVVLAALIAFSRLYLYVHFPSDVIAGAVIGGLCALVSYRIVGRTYSKKISSRRKS